MAAEPTQDDLRQLVQREVHYCVSSLVHTLAQGYGDSTSSRDLSELCEQAFELSTSTEDYEEAAEQEGWEIAERIADRGFIFAKREDGGVVDEMQCVTWGELCEHQGIEPYEWEVYEHWIVSDWLADKLIAQGERVDKDFAGLTIWGRTTTGQAIAMDSVIARIWRDLHKEEA